MSNIVLVVDDDLTVSNLLSKVIKDIGFNVHTVMGGIEALKALDETEYCLVLLDINMPDMNGFEVLKTIRNKGINIPVMIVSGRKEDFDTVYGLDIGADDYITKPFNPTTLGAKVKALIRRSKSNEQKELNEIVYGPFSYNTSTLRLFKNGEEVTLSSKENAIMKLFLDNAGKIFSKDMLYSLVWGNQIIDENAVTVYINHLRQKIDDNSRKTSYIQNIRGIGYKFSV